MITKLIVMLAVAGVTVFMAAGILRADAPDLEAPVFIQEGGGDLKVDYCSVPCAVDWNNDGAKDLLVGQFSYGYIKLFLNRGTDLNPLFNGWSYVESNGSPITASYG